MGWFDTWIDDCISGVAPNLKAAGAVVVYGVNTLVDDPNERTLSLLSQINASAIVTEGASLLGSLTFNVVALRTVGISGNPAFTFGSTPTAAIRKLLFVHNASARLIFTTPTIPTLNRNYTFTGGVIKL